MERPRIQEQIDLVRSMVARYPSVTLQVFRLSRTRFEDEVGIAAECSLIEPQLAHRPDGINTLKRPCGHTWDDTFRIVGNRN
jgi:hypothetical protein